MDNDSNSRRRYTFTFCLATEKGRQVHLCTLINLLDRQIELLYPIAALQRQIVAAQSEPMPSEERWVKVKHDQVALTNGILSASYTSGWCSGLEKDYDSLGCKLAARRLILSNDLFFELLMLHSLKASTHRQLAMDLLNGHLKIDGVKHKSQQEAFPLHRRLTPEEMGNARETLSSSRKETLEAASKQLRAAAASYVLLAYRVCPFLTQSSLGLSPPERHGDIVLGFRDACLFSSLSCFSYLAAQKRSKPSVLSRLLSGMAYLSFSALLRLRSNEWTKDTTAEHVSALGKWYSFGRPTIPSKDGWEKLSSQVVDELSKPSQDTLGTHILPLSSEDGSSLPSTDEEVQPAKDGIRKRLPEFYLESLSGSALLSRAMLHKYAAKSCRAALQLSLSSLPVSLLGHQSTEVTDDKATIFEACFSHSKAVLAWLSACMDNYGISLEVTSSDTAMASSIRKEYGNNKDLAKECENEASSIYFTACPDVDPLVIPAYTGPCLFPPQVVNVEDSACSSEMLSLSLYSSKRCCSSFYDSTFTKDYIRYLSTYDSSVEDRYDRPIKKS